MDNFGIAVRRYGRNVMNRLEGRFAARQIPGKREYQEDDYGLIEGVDSDSNEVLVIADGMGGQVGGDYGQPHSYQNIYRDLFRHNRADI